LLQFLKQTGKKIGKSFRKRSAETILEVIMALFVVATGSATATSLVVNSLQSNSFSRDNLIGLNLAVEGVEAVRNIRDTNWLKFGYDKTNCWNVMPGLAVTDCSSASAISAGNYTLSLDPATMSWSLAAITAGGLDLTNGNPATNSNYLLYNNANSLYVATQPGNTPSRFYRMITISYPPPATPAKGQTQMTVTSTVQWKAGALTHQVVLRTILTNYQKVKVT
jgi:hypothetical protein